MRAFLQSVSLNQGHLRSTTTKLKYYSSMVARGGLTIDPKLHKTVVNILDGTNVSEEIFWKGLEASVVDLFAENISLLAKRDAIQSELDTFHKLHPNPASDLPKYKSFLESIGYLLPRVEEFIITTTNVDEEISELCGPQLVVPVDNKRFVLNAANARWGSLHAAFYGTNAIFAKSNKGSRDEKVLLAMTDVLSKYFPLVQTESGVDYANVDRVRINEFGELLFYMKSSGGSTAVCTGLSDKSAFVGYTGPSLEEPTTILLKHHGLHMELVLTPPSTTTSSANNEPNACVTWLKDISVESALSTICDLEDSVATVDGEDKAVAYSNWAGLMRGDLATKLPNGSSRTLAPDKMFKVPPTATGAAAATTQPLLVLPGRSMLLVRNVGIHMMTDSVKYGGEEIPEGIIDAYVSVVAGIHSLKNAATASTASVSSSLLNSRHGSIYVVKPKLHGPQEVRFTMKLFDQVEQALGLPKNTVKVGIMDEERRTSLNLAACLKEASERLVFINTGFLDRTGDEIHSVMTAGAVLPKDLSKKELWLNSYERNNVSIGLHTKLPGKGQIGKGMWAAPDEMGALMKEKSAHPLSGASTAWVPSPVAATLHALHYHEVDVMQVRSQLDQPSWTDDVYVNGLLHPPLVNENVKLSKQEIQNELDQNVQAILGYVVRWVNQGVGCSKVPDLKGTFLMEDRATLRIASQLLANWLYHGLISKDEVMESLNRMAVVVDGQNEGSTGYIAMVQANPHTTGGRSSPLATSVAFNAAVDLIFQGVQQPNGYTEETLNARRRQVKEHGPLIK